MLFSAQMLFDESSACILEELADDIETGASRQVSPPVPLAVSRENMLDSPHEALFLRRMDALSGSLARQVDGDVVVHAASEVTKEWPKVPKDGHAPKLENSEKPFLSNELSCRRELAK